MAMEDLASWLRASLNPSSVKQAEKVLKQFAVEPNALQSLLSLVLDESQDREVRQAAIVQFKLAVERRWFEDQEEPPIDRAEKQVIRSQLLPAMGHLSAQSVNKPILNQVTAVITLISQADFPDEWPDLVTNLAGALSPTAVTSNIAVLETAHAIFAPWRAAIRTDELYSLINLVLSQFLEAFLSLFRATSSLLIPDLQPNPETARQMSLLLSLFHDLTCQDLPPAIEDAHDEFFNPTGGVFIKLLLWNPPSLIKAADDETTDPSLPSSIKTSILETLELYVNRYPELLEQTGGLQAFVVSVWNLVSSSSQISPISDDAMITQSLRFLATSIRSGHYTQLFSAKETMSRIIEDVIVPNVQIREHEIEQIEDNPLEYIRIELSPTASASSEGSTRRQASADVLRAFVGLNPEAATELAGAWINKGLEVYASNPGMNWKAKDTAIYLLTALASRSSTTQQGVTSTNALVDVIEFFGKHVYQDLSSDDPAHPLLRVDAIRYIQTFRAQLTKEQLISVLPLLIKHLGSTDFVSYTYAAIAIEKILFIKQNNHLLFTQADIHDLAPGMLTALFGKIDQSGDTPEKIAENEYLMKCAMRVILTARQSLMPLYEPILTKLINIVGIMSKNPSNPNFSQFCFESISALIRFVVASKPETLSSFEQSLFAPFTYILQADVEEYVPYVFQLLAQLLEHHPPQSTSIPAAYTSILPLLTTPAVWQQKGSVPGLVRLLRAFLAKDAQAIVASGQLEPVLAVLQQRLIPSKINDGWGFELLEGVITYIKSSDLARYQKALLLSLLTRLNSNRTDKFAYGLARFLCFACAIQKENDAAFQPDFVIRTVEDIQQGLWGMLLTQVVLPEVPKSPPRDRKLIAVGLTRILCRSQIMITAPSSQAWPSAFDTLSNLFMKSQVFTKGRSDADADAAVTEIDFEEQASGYQTSYSKLAASENAPYDPVAYVADPQQHLAEELSRAMASDPSVKQYIQMSQPKQELLQTLASKGLSL